MLVCLVFTIWSFGSTGRRRRKWKCELYVKFIPNNEKTPQKTLPKMGSSWSLGFLAIWRQYKRAPYRLTLTFWMPPPVTKTTTSLNQNKTKALWKRRLKLMMGREKCGLKEGVKLKTLMMMVNLRHLYYKSTDAIFSKHEVGTPLLWWHCDFTNPINTALCLSHDIYKALDIIMSL